MSRGCDLKSTHNSGVQGGEASLPGSGVSPANFSLPCVCLRRTQVMSGFQGVLNMLYLENAEVC